MKNSSVVLGLAFCVGAFSSCGSGNSNSNNAASVAGDGSALSSNQKTTVLNLTSAINRTQTLPNVIKPALPNGDAVASGTTTTASTSTITDPTLQTMQTDLKNATCDASWTLTPDSNSATTTATSLQHQVDSFKVAGSQCPVAYSDITTNSYSADLATLDSDEQTSYTVLDKASFGKLNDVVAFTFSSKLHSTTSMSSSNTPVLTSMSSTFSGQVISSTLGTLSISGTTASSGKTPALHIKTRTVITFSGFQAVIRDESYLSADGTSLNEKEYLNGAQLTQDEMKLVNGSGTSN